MISSNLNKLSVNEDIKARYVVLIDEEGTGLGTVSLQEALAVAKQRGYDLVQVGQKQDPPVCKLLDYSKYRYRLSKKQHTKKKQKISITKELKLRPRIDTHDFELRIKRGKQFLSQGYKVKYTLSYRGREMAISDRGKVLFKQIIEQLQEVSEVESYPNEKMFHQALVLVPSAQTVQTD